MPRKYVDCREVFQSKEKRCTVAISADSKEELLEAAVQHGMAVHDHADTKNFREQILKSMKEGHPAS
jgi:predicted small metal-binding protein